MPPRFQLWIDFDGTLVVPNLAMVLVERFGLDGPKVSKEVDERLHRGEITLRQAWEREVAILPPERLEEMVAYAKDHTPLRSGARELIDLANQHQVPAAVVSGGVDFYIRPVLEREGIDWPVFTESLVHLPSGRLGISHPHGHATCRLCGICKAQVVRSVRDRVTVYIGDGSTDRYAAEVADIVFARHRLLAYCRKEGIPAIEFEDLSTVAGWLRAHLADPAPAVPSRSLGRTGTPCPISQALTGRPSGPSDLSDAR